MLRFTVITILLFAPIIIGGLSGSTVQAPWTLTGAAAITNSTPISNVQSHNQFSTGPHNQYNATTWKPSGTWGGHSSAGTSSSSLSSLLPDFGETCVLWNTSCSGNKTHAMDEFFTNITHALYDDVCFLGGPTECLNMTSSQKSARYGQVKDWMRSPQCYSDYAEWSSLRSEKPSAPLVMNNDGMALAEVENICCSGCAISAGNVDLYYWPEANASTSCLEIIGSSRFPLDYGATTDVNGTYWGCTGQDSTLTKTAHITTINAVSQKVYLKDPWSSDPCSRPPSSQFSPITSAGSFKPRPSVFARAHSLITTSSIQNTDLPIAIAVVGNFTFTSPSIYAIFHDLVTDDICGGRTSVLSTMLTFSPGELQTWGGHLGPMNSGRPLYERKPFDFRDLPCPPQNVMEENWYKPHEGEPYRPLIALPSQIQEMNVGHATCGGGNFFTGIDPPRSLTPAMVSVPTTTSRDPKALIETAMPSPSPLAGAKSTTTDKASTSAPSHTPIVEQAKETNTRMLGLKQGVPDPQSHLYGPVMVVPQVKPSTQPGFVPQETSREFRQGSSVSDSATPTSNQDIPKLPFQTITSSVSSDPVPKSDDAMPRSSQAIPKLPVETSAPGHTIVSSDPASKSTPISQDSDPSNGVPTVTGPKPNPPFGHLPATALATNDTPQDPSPKSKDQRPDPPQIVGTYDLNKPQTTMDPVLPVDAATYQYDLGHSSNLVIASGSAQIGDHVISVAGVQVGLPLSANNIAIGGSNFPIEAPALVATTVRQISGSSILETNTITLPFSLIQNPKSYSIARPVITAATIPVVDVDGITLIPTLDTATVNGALTTSATPGHLPIILNPDAPGLSERTKSSEARKTEKYGCVDHSTELDLPTGKGGSTGTSDHSTFDLPVGKVGSTSTGDHSRVDSSTGKAGGSTSIDDHSNVDSPTGKVGSTTTSDHSAVSSPTGKVGSTSTGTQGTYSTGDHPTSDSPTGKVGSTSTGKQILEGGARSWKSCVDWKRVGLTGLLIGILLR